MSYNENEKKPKILWVTPPLKFGENNYTGFDSMDWMNGVISSLGRNGIEVVKYSKPFTINNSFFQLVAGSDMVFIEWTSPNQKDAENKIRNQNNMIDMITTFGIPVFIFDSSVDGSAFDFKNSLIKKGIRVRLVAPTLITNNEKINVGYDNHLLGKPLLPTTTFGESRINEFVEIENGRDYLFSSVVPSNESDSDHLKSLQSSLIFSNEMIEEFNFVLANENDDVYDDLSKTYLTIQTLTPSQLEAGIITANLKRALNSKCIVGLLPEFNFSGCPIFESLFRVDKIWENFEFLNQKDYMEFHALQNYYSTDKLQTPIDVWVTEIINFINE